jgi:KamA family protein
MTSTVVDLSEESPERAKYRAITLHNIAGLPQAERLSNDQRFAIDVVSRVLPFKTNNYVVDELINWDDVPNDPIFTLTFPQQHMLQDEHFDEVATLVSQEASRAEIDEAANRIRMTLNPHPAGQLEHNVPVLYEETVEGLQHKYEETVLLFPSNGQTCHAYCTFCFRWPQFVGLEGKKFAMREGERLRGYLAQHHEVSDVLFTGGDPLIMKTKTLRDYIEPLTKLDAGHNLRTVRIGSKAIAYWPHRFVYDDDAEDLLVLFREVTGAGMQLALMAHFNHPAELRTSISLEAVRRIRETGAQIRTQTPLLKHINADSQLLADMWAEQTQAGCVPYYLFVARDTGAKRYFELPLVECQEIFRGAYQRVSGVGRTVRGPSMSAGPGKVQILGVSEHAGEKLIILRFLQGRDPDWVGKPFFAKYSDTASWLDELEPAEGDEFFFEERLRELLAEEGSPWARPEIAIQLLDTAAAGL